MSRPKGSKDSYPREKGKPAHNRGIPGPLEGKCYDEIYGEKAVLEAKKRSDGYLRRLGVDVNLVDEMKSKGYRYCKNHKSFLPFSFFGREGYRCDLCSILDMYSVTFEWYSSTIKLQLGLCAICNAQLLGKSCIDHNHSCCSGLKSCGSCLRGILCFRCNMTLGFIENSTWVANAQSYLQHNLTYST